MSMPFILSTADRELLCDLLADALNGETEEGAIVGGDKRVHMRKLFELFWVKPNEVPSAEETQPAPTSAWKKVSEEHYRSFLEAVPPAFMHNPHFLVGEAHDIRKCNVTGGHRATYRAFVQFEGDYFEGSPMTRDEFRVFLEQPHRDVRKLLQAAAEG